MDFISLIPDVEAIGEQPVLLNSVLCIAEREDCRRPSDDIGKHQQSNQVYVHVCTFKGPRVCVCVGGCVLVCVAV